MSLLNLIVLIILVGLFMWAVNAYIPMPSLIKSLLNFLVFIILVIYILQFFHIINTILPFPNIFRS